MNEDTKTKALKYGAIAAAILTPLLTKYGVDSELINGCVTGVCMIALSVMPSVLSKWGK